MGPPLASGGGHSRGASRGGGVAANAAPTYVLLEDGPASGGSGGGSLGHCRISSLEHIDGAPGWGAQQRIEVPRCPLLAPASSRSFHLFFFLLNIESLDLGLHVDFPAFCFV